MARDPRRRRNDIVYRLFVTMRTCREFQSLIALARPRCPPSMSGFTLEQLESHARMKYRKLGRTGYNVSEIGHGLWGMSGWSGSEDRESLDSLQQSVDLGCNFFDTAWAYGEGHSDELMGKILQRNSDKRLYVASKIPPKNRRWPASQKDPYDDVFPLDHVMQYADKIRQAMGVDRIDLLQFHVWEDAWADEGEFRSTVEHLKGQNIVESFGLS